MSESSQQRPPTPARTSSRIPVDGNPSGGGASTSSTSSSSSSSSSPPQLRQQVAEVLDLMRPAIQSDGGDVELVDVTADGEVTVRLHGACVGCPSSSMTLKAGIERNLKIHVAGVQSVEAIA